MAEDQKLGELEKTNLYAPRTTKVPVSFSVPSSPRNSLMKQSGKINCLCSPTTHPGSFRCRYHRNNKSMEQGLTRSSMSVGSKLSELARKPTGSSVLCSP